MNSAAVLQLGNTKVVVCGDNEYESLEILMQNSKFVEAVKDAYVLVAPHHGRESAYHNSFAKLVNPYITIISDTKKTDCSAVSKYEAISRGYDFKGEKRKCLTTRKDGHIYVMFGQSDNPNCSGILGLSTIQPNPFRA